MADYYPLLAKAVAGLPESSADTRRAIYERARKALLGQLRKIDPPIAETDIARENTALDEAVARLESEIAGKAARALGDDAAQESAPADLPATAKADAEPTEAPAPAAPLPKIAIPPRSPALGANGQKPFSFRPPAATAAERPVDVDQEDVDPAPTDASPLDIKPPPPRMREAVRPAAPAAPSSGGASKRFWILGAVAAGVILLVAGLAFKLRDQGPQGLARLGQGAGSPAAETAPSGKIVDRVEKPAAPPAGQSSAPGAGAASGPSQAPVPVAHRAALLIEAPETADKVKTYIGSVVWRLDSVPTGAGRPLGAAIKAEVDIPEAKVRMTLEFQKNYDETLPASHTVNVGFTILPGSEVPGVKQIGAIQMRREDASNGDPLAGIPVQITENVYLIGLAQGEMEARNMDLLKNRGWVDLPFALSNGRIAKFSLEKGPSGDRVIADAITAWMPDK